MNSTRLINRFLQLTRIESPSGKEELVREYVVQELEQLGISYEIDQTGNLFAKTSGRGDSVLFCAHLDTVGPCSNIQPKVENGWIVGDGENVLGADNKAAVAAILEAIHSVPADQRRPVELLFTVREETDGGINYFDFSKLQSTFGLVADSELPVGSIVLSSPSMSDFEIEVKGKSAHTSTLEEGINALSIAAHAIAQINWSSVVEGTIANIGLIEGGVATNTVPDRIILKGEVRSATHQGLQEGITKISSLFQTEAKKLGGEIVFKEFPYCTGYQFLETDESIVRVKKIMEKLGLTVSYHESLGASDANALTDHEVQMVNIGDGAVDIHTNREKISIQSLEQLTKVFEEACINNL
jgi:tripeptide aminopeptidase